MCLLPTGNVYDFHWCLRDCKMGLSFLQRGGVNTVETTRRFMSSRFDRQSRGACSRNERAMRPSVCCTGLFRAESRVCCTGDATALGDHTKHSRSKSKVPQYTLIYHATCLFWASVSEAQHRIKQHEWSDTTGK